MQDFLDVPEIYVSGLERFENAGGGNLRVCLYLMRDDVKVPGEVTIIFPLAAMPDAIAKAITAMVTAGLCIANILPTLNRSWMM